MLLFSSVDPNNLLFLLGYLWHKLVRNWICTDWLKTLFGKKPSENFQNPPPWNLCCMEFLNQTTAIFLNRCSFTSEAQSANMWIIPIDFKDILFITSTAVMTIWTRTQAWYSHQQRYKISPVTCLERTVSVTTCSWNKVACKIKVNFKMWLFFCFILLFYFAIFYVT